MRVIEDTMARLDYSACQKAAMLCAITLFGCFTVNSVMHDPYWNSGPRDLDLVELWSGVEALARHGESIGLRTACHDRLKDPGNPQYDITTLSGFSTALKLVMRIREGGLLAMGPDCSSFVFAPSVHAQRRNGAWEGNTKHQFVRDGNLMASMAGFFMCLAIARGVEAFIENPAGSMIFSFLQGTLSRLAWTTTAFLDRCAFVSDSQRSTENWLKTFKFVATGRWILKAVKRCACTESHAELMDTGPEGQKNGRRGDMKRSGAYPDLLGAALVNAWLSYSAPQDFESAVLATATPCRAKRAAHQLQPSSHVAIQLSSHPAGDHSGGKRRHCTKSAVQVDSEVLADDEFTEWINPISDEPASAADELQAGKSADTGSNSSQTAMEDEFASWPSCPSASPAVQDAQDVQDEFATWADPSPPQDEFAAWAAPTPDFEDEYGSWLCS